MLHLVFLEIDIYQQTRNKHPDGYAQNRQTQPDSNGMPRRDTSIQLSVIEIIIDNSALGMVRQWQTLYYGERYSATVIRDKVDYCKVAEGLGCMAIRVTDPSEVEPALKKALSSGVPTVIDVVIDEDDKVFPMVSPGAPIEKSFDASDLEARGGKA